ncbi:TPA: hypothetical protein DCZ15_03055 [Candidatus Falkowbacteria bacterium]|nr:MAG: hypothetical protein UV95_C0001G0263 [Candidatus Falkowbacteria bacterium GW2011_GWF2_43_32]HBA36829.1 hypothetical protein [Candidatus Falkowbacteria bacterium]
MEAQFFRITLYGMMAIQMLAWGWFSYKAGKLSDKSFLMFTAMMMIGQIGAGIETVYLQAWGAFSMQIYFLIFTLFGGIRRYSSRKKGS